MSNERQAWLTEDSLEKALNQAFNLGQTYWQQADSEYVSEHKKADVTRDKYQALVAATKEAFGIAAQSADAGNGEWVESTDVVAIRELLAHICDVVPDYIWELIDTTKWNAVSGIVGRHEADGQDAKRLAAPAAPAPKLTPHAADVEQMLDGDEAIPAEARGADKRDAEQISSWLLTDPETGERLRFAGPLEKDFFGLSRVRMETASGSVWTLTAGLTEGYLSAAERMANIHLAASRDGK